MKNRFSGKAEAIPQHFRAPFLGNFGAFVGGVGRGVAHLVALDDVGIDKGTREAGGDTGLEKRGFSDTIKVGNKYELRRHLAPRR